MAQLQQNKAFAPLVFAGFLAACIFGFFTPGGPAQGTHGVIFLLVGILMIVVAPAWRLPWGIYAAAAAVAVFSALSFLPAGKTDWRRDLEAAGLDLGGMATAQPDLTFNYWIGLVLAIVGALYLFGFRVKSDARFKLAFCFVLAVGVYTAISMWSADSGTGLPWDIDKSFGLFPNRNHTATLLVMGAICGCGVLLQLAMDERWMGAAVSGICVGLMVWSLLGYSASRAGVLLLGLVFIAWLFGLGRRFLDYRAIISIVVLGGLCLLLFLASDTRVKERLTEEPVAGKKDAAGALVAGQEEVDVASFDFRVLVYRDAISMLAAEPMTGVGLGNFRYVFPMYRTKSISKSRCVHPESDWIWLAAEAGLLSAIAAAAGVGFLLFRTIWGTRNRSGWILRWTCFLAAAVVPFHGLFDVPGHRIGLAWTAVFLCGIAAVYPKKRGMEAGGAARWGFRLAGLAFLLVGGLLVRAEWFGGSDFTAALPVKTRSEVLRLHAEDAAIQETLEAGETIQGEDKIEVALGLLDETLKKVPLDSDLQFLQGALALFYDDKGDLARQSFQVQRLLIPNWPTVAAHQAQSWIEVSPETAAELWKEAMRRADLVDRISADRTAEATFSSIVKQAAEFGVSEELWGFVRNLAGDNFKRTETWVKLAPPQLAASEVDRINAEGQFSESDRAHLSLWKKRRLEEAVPSASQK